ncbi:FMN-dependent NADH-azoreductase [Paenibacillus piri]|uniref:FMN dependent NADH:quinone oxidoreductase n=1 Tax=Paenibacillus piri TaxID=2547395 RepID=A0A4R5KK18_9BACL|nr:FMN-dependent NADH-azoreductase [Paenibacillus piri]TDF95786.1 FMN-dependent NADH-azoreductase [Paenibacillus piri]
MSTVLFVKANGRPIEQAASVKMYHTFLDTYKQSHPGDTIVELDLFAEELPYYDTDTLNGLFKLGKGMELSAVEQQKAANVNKYLDQFLAADKVVFAFPLWNFTVPAQLLTYLFYILQAGKTFSYTPQGPVGLQSDKKVALLNARGGVYSEGPAAAIEMSLNYVKTIMGFIGVTNVSTVVIEGHNQFPDKAASIIEEGLKQTAAAAQSF